MSRWDKLDAVGGWAARMAVRREVVTSGRALHGKFLRRKAWSVGDKTCKAELSSVQSGWASTQDAWRTQGDGIPELRKG